MPLCFPMGWALSEELAPCRTRVGGFSGGGRGFYERGGVLAAVLSSKSKTWALSVPPDTMIDDEAGFSGAVGGGLCRFEGADCVRLNRRSRRDPALRCGAREPEEDLDLFRLICSPMPRGASCALATLSRRAVLKLLREVALRFLSIPSSMHRQYNRVGHSINVSLPPCNICEGIRGH